MKKLNWYFTHLAVVCCSAFGIGSFPNEAKAETTSRAFPFTQQIMVTVYKSRVTGSDQDARTLFESMNVPLRDSFLGPGKSIESVDRGLSWVCGDRGANGIQCTIMLKASASTQVSYKPVSARFKASGNEAHALFQLLNPNTPEGNFTYGNEEGTLKIEATPTGFQLSFVE